MRWRRNQPSLLGEAVSIAGDPVLAALNARQRLWNAQVEKRRSVFIWCVAAAVMLALITAVIIICLNRIAN